MPERSLDALSSAFFPKAVEWIARVTAHGIAVLVIQTRRTPEEHQANLAAGTSGTTFSLHLPRRLRPSTLAGLLDAQAFDADKADAMDIAPFEQYHLHGPDKIRWDARDPAWGVIGEEAERVGLRSGIRWKRPFDPGHAELWLPVRERYRAEELGRPWPTFRA